MTALRFSTEAGRRSAPFIVTLPHRNAGGFEKNARQSDDDDGPLGRTDAAQLHGVERQAQLAWSRRWRRSGLLVLHFAPPGRRSGRPGSFADIRARIGVDVVRRARP